MKGLSRAVRVATTKARHKCHRHAALLFNGKQIVMAGHNHEAVHAEEDVLRRCYLGTKRAELSMLVIRVRRDGRLGMARPCASCRDLLALAGVRKVYYTDANGDVVREKA